MSKVSHLLDRSVSVYAVVNVQGVNGRWTEDMAATPSQTGVRCRFSSPTGAQIALGLQVFGQVVMSAYFEPDAVIEPGQVLVDEGDGRTYDVRAPAGDNDFYNKFLVSWWTPSERSAMVV